jgi:hypothetical protein
MVHRSPCRSVCHPFERLHRFFDVARRAGTVVEAFRFIEAERRSVFGEAAICARLDARRSDRQRLSERLRR